MFSRGDANLDELRFSAVVVYSRYECNRKDAAKLVWSIVRLTPQLIRVVFGWTLFLQRRKCEHSDQLNFYHGCIIIGF